MKTTATSAALLALSACLAWGQSASSEILGKIPTIPLENVQRHIHFKSPQEVKGPGVRYGGVLHLIQKADNPLQLINPLAPARYGDGSQNVVFTPVSNRPDGIAFFAIRF